MFAHIQLGAGFIAWIVLLFFALKLKSHRNESKLGERFNNVAWDIAVYGTDEAFREELKHWRWSGRWKRKLLDLRHRRAEVAKWWADRKANNLLPV